MRIVVVDPSRRVPYYDRGLCGALSDAGAEVSLLTAPDVLYGSGSLPPGVAVVETFGTLIGSSQTRRAGVARRATIRRLLRGLGYPMELRAAVRLIVGWRPDVVQLQWSLVPALDARATVRLRECGAVVVFTAHNVLPHEARPWHAGCYRRLYRAMDLIVVHSRATRERLLALGGIEPSRVAVIGMPAEMPDRRPDRRTSRAALGLAPDRPLIVFFGHVRPYKGLETLLESLPMLLQAIPDARLVVAGALNGGRRNLASLRRRVAQLGLGTAVDLRIGFVPHHQVTDYFAAADVVALPYVAVDDSAVLATARGHGRAVVATAVGSLAEPLASGGGIVVRPSCPSEMADALGRILADAALRHDLEREARAAAKAWGWPQAAAAHLAAYREAVGRAA